MIDKTVRGRAEALDGIADGATVLLGGFGAVGQPDVLIEALFERGARDLTIVANNAGSGEAGHLFVSALRRRGGVRAAVPVGPGRA